MESPYGAICRSFNKLAFQDEDSEHSLTLQERDMIEVGDFLLIFLIILKYSFSILNHSLVHLLIQVDPQTLNIT